MGATGICVCETTLIFGYSCFNCSPIAGRVTSALNARFHTMQTVSPAKLFRRGTMLIILTVLSPIGLTTLYTDVVDPP